MKMPKKINGAGVILIDLNNNLLLVKDHNNKYSDFGGYHEDIHDSLEKTAKCELREESLNLFNFYKLDYNDNYFDCHYKNNIYYRCYFLKINQEIDINLYYQNKKIINRKKKIRKCWKETEDICSVSLEEFKKNINNKNNNCNNINNIEINLRNRTWKILKKFVKKNMNLPIIDVNLINEKKQFIKNTFSYICPPK